jgi:hypothetical protein
MPQIEILSEAEAQGVWSMRETVRKNVDAELVLRLDSEGHYWETNRKVDGYGMI